MSGVINDLMPKRGQSGKEIAEAVMEELGVSSVKELEKVPYAQLAAAYLKVRPTFQAQGKYSGGAPIPNEFYVGDPSDVGFRKESSNVALMVGTHRHIHICLILNCRLMAAGFRGIAQISHMSLQTHHSRHIHRKQVLQSASRQRFLTVLCHLRAQVIQTTAQFLIGRRAHQIISIHS